MNITEVVERVEALLAYDFGDESGHCIALAEAAGALVNAARSERPAECALCVGECRGHSLGHPDEWKPEPGSQVALAGERPAAESDVESVIVEAARRALLVAEAARTDVVNPVNGTRSYTFVSFHGQRVIFQEGEFEIDGDAGSGAAGAYATKINDALFELAKVAARAALTAIGKLNGEGDDA